MPKSALPALLALFLAACAENPLRADSSPAFLAGYNDGCATGSARLDPKAPPQTTVLNKNRYNSEPDYASGWQNGLRECDGTHLTDNPNNPNEQVDIFGQDWY
ncbi:hypothetical protein [Methylomagnum ishizawai]|uniref:hypothetical protein n=1 Tax=Methylomagnum ishizawai TaxID=1760988 RepID=UPI001C32FC0E|nr:hypothetical protein [Methylomagnum ishizawai]BBL76698.1 hypothetical protein MishRS11D_37960 [Methylomagnum ishizawai]